MGRGSRPAANGRLTEPFAWVTAGGRTLPSILHETLQSGLHSTAAAATKAGPRPGSAPLRLPRTPRVLARIPLLHHPAAAAAVPARSAPPGQESTHHPRRRAPAPD